MKSTVAFLGALLLLCSISLSASAAVVDQSFLAPTNEGASINDGFRYVGQTFTAGQTGMLEGISVDISGYSATTGMLRFDIFQAENMLPTTTLLGSTLTGKSGSLISEYVALSAPISVVAGSQYAIVASYYWDGEALAHGPANCQATWSGATGNLYAGGQIVIGNDGAPWDYYSGCDSFFKTYMAGDAAQVPEPSTFLLLGAGLFGLAAFRGKRS